MTARAARTFAFVVALALFGGTGALVALASSGPEPRVSGIEDGELLGHNDLRRATLRIQAETDVTVEVDGSEIPSDRSGAGDDLVFPLADLRDGRHVIQVAWPRPWPLPDATRRWTLTVDTTPPAIRVLEPRREVDPGAPVAIVGEVERDAELKAEGEPVEIEGGRFEIRYAEPPSSAVVLEATDRFGNSATTSVRIKVAGVRGVHVTAYAWASSALRRPVLRLVDRGLIDAVQLDLKDESGMIGYDSKLAFARRIGSVESVYELKPAIKLLHARGVQVVGRIVAFRDPVLAKHSWGSGHRERVIQTSDRRPYGGYGGFTNFADPVVRRYNVDIAEEAAAAGIDDVLYDYVRRPDGPLGKFFFPGLEGPASRAVAGFVAEASERLGPRGVAVGASVYGIAASRPEQIAQRIPLLARHADYISPMVYPSHWGSGEYGVDDPNRQPYLIVKRSLRDFLRQVKGTGARIVPWLQDFSLGVRYGEREVRAQINAARAVGIHEWLLWDPEVTYTAAALEER